MRKRKLLNSIHFYVWLSLDNRLNEYKCLNCGHVGNNERRETKTWFENSKKLLENLNLLNLNESSVNLIEEELKKATELGLNNSDDSEPGWINFVKLSELLMEHYITNGNDQKASLLATQNLCDNYMLDLVFGLFNRQIKFYILILIF